MKRTPFTFAVLTLSLCTFVACGPSAREQTGDDGPAPDAHVDADPNPADAAPIQLIPVRSLPGLASITFYERTGGTAPTEYTFAVDSHELTTRETDPLDATTADIQGIPGDELYDVYYSDEDGTFNLDGAYLTISGVFTRAAPSGGGLNLAEMRLNTPGHSSEFGTIVGSYQVLGNNAIEPDVTKCIDGDLQTSTTMGNTTGQSDRLRITLGFPSTVVIE